MQRLANTFAAIVLLLALALLAAYMANHAERVDSETAAWGAATPSHFVAPTHTTADRLYYF